MRQTEPSGGLLCGAGALPDDETTTLGQAIPGDENDNEPVPFGVWKPETGRICDDLLISASNVFTTTVLDLVSCNSDSHCFFW